MFLEILVFIALLTEHRVHLRFGFRAVGRWRFHSPSTCFIEYEGLLTKELLYVLGAYGVLSSCIGKFVSKLVHSDVVNEAKDPKGGQHVS